MILRQLGASVAAVLLCITTAQAGGPPEVCGDVNETSTVTPADALLVLKKSVGQTIELICPAIKGLASCEEDLGVCLGDSCGDGEVNAVGEQCDENDLNGTDCADLGYGLGDLDCDDECRFDTSGCEPCEGVVYEGTCWFLGTNGQSCSDVCSNEGQVYDDATRTVAGSEGSDDDCEKLLDALDAPGSGLQFPAFGCGVDFPNGCAEENLDRGRCATPATTSSGSGGDTKRVCACTTECPGVAYAGACWFLGKMGQTCDQVCDGVDRSYDDATRYVAGSDGTDQACEVLLDSLGAPGTGLEFGSFDCSNPLGCLHEDGLRGRCATPTTTSGDSQEDAFRVCACQ